MKIYRLLRTAKKIDLFDACYALSNEVITPFDDLPMEFHPPKGVLRAIARYVFRMTHRKYVRQKGVVNFLFYADSRNGEHALAFIKDHYQGSFISRASVLRRQADFWSLFFFPKVLLAYVRGLPLRRQVMSRYFDEYWSFYAMFIGAVFYLRAVSPKAVFFANDHSVSPRAVFLAAKYLGIKTIYLQHASITSRMPPLSYDLALLDGPATLEQYEDSGPVTSRVEFVGMPRMDVSASAISLSSDKVIGLCTTLLDQVDSVTETVRILKSAAQDYKIKLRFHPSETVARQEAWRALCREFGLQESLAQREPIVEFLQSVSVLIAGDCAVHLESSLLGVPSVLVPWSSAFSDRYGYVKNGLVTCCGVAADLVSQVLKARVSFDALSRYVAVPDMEEARRKTFSAVDSLLEMER